MAKNVAREHAGGLSREALFTQGLPRNITATSNPGTGDDIDSGYNVGSIWVNVSSDAIYFCADASSGAAVWGLSGSAAVTQIDGLSKSDGNFIVGNGSAWVAESGATARTSLGLGTAAVAATGISNTNVPVFTSGVADNDFLRIDGTSVEGLSAAEVAAAIESSIDAVGTIASGTWEATDIAVAHGGTGASSLTDGGVLLGSGTGAITAMAVLSDGEMIVGDGSTDPVAESGATLRTSIGVGTTDSPQFAGATLASSSASEPILHITNTHAGATSGILRFNKDTASGDDNDVMGTIEFYGTDAAENTHERLAYIDSYLVDSAHGSEAAGLRFYVAENDATLTQGLALTGQADDDGEIDVTLGAGTASTTTIAGTLTMGSTAALTNAGLVAVANQSGITGLGTISSGTWEATDVAIAHGGTGASSAGDARTNLGLGTAATASTGISNTNVPVFTTGVADDDFLRVAGTSIEGRSASEVLSDIGAQASLTFGISNTNAVKIDAADVADDEYARFTANGLESRSTSEVLSDIGGQASLTFGISNTNAVKIDAADVADDEYARFTANGLESRTAAEVAADIEGSIDAVGTIASGVWQGTAIASGYMAQGTTSAKGALEIATTAEINTSTDADRAMTPDLFAASNYGIRYVQIMAVAADTDLTVADGLAYFHVPAGLNGMDLVEVHAEVFTAPVGSTATFEISLNGASTQMLSTNITIDASETGSDTAATAAVINTSTDDVDTNDLIQINCTQVGSSTAGKGLLVTMGFRIP